MRHTYILVIGLLFTCMISQKVLSQTIYQIGTVEGSAAVSPTGAATYQIPIKVSEGTNGMQPSISINYNSQAGNGLLGYGWELSGTSSITRTGKNFYFDGKSESVKLNSTDNLMLDGVRLILETGTHFQTEAVYRKEVEDFSRIVLNGSDGVGGIKVLTKDGRILEYGTTADSYIKVSATQSPICWMLSKITDRFGNYMKYTYTEITPGESCISQIDYTGNSAVQPYDSVRFIYNSNRPDSITRYVAGYPVRQKSRLYRIDCYHNTTAIRSYTFSYDNLSVYSKLTSVTESGSSQSQYKPTTITYSAASPGITSVDSICTYDNPAGRDKHQFADFDGDGKTDVFSYKTVNGQCNGYLYLNTGSLFSYQTIINFGANFVDITPCDLNGDGLLDIIAKYSVSGSFSFKHYLYNGSSFNFQTGVSYTADYPTVLPGDFNGDGKFELLTQKNFNGSGKNALLINLDGSFIGAGGITNWGKKLKNSFPNNCYLIDFNGNGKTDVITLDASGYYIYEYNSGISTFQLIETSNSSLLNRNNPAYFADFNGDGMTDVLVHNYTTKIDYVLYSTGISFVETSVGNQDIKNYVFVSDCNRDGLPDILHAERVSNSQLKLKIGVFNGKTFVKESHTLNIATTSTDITTGELCDSIKDSWVFNASDFTGDSRTDFCVFTNDNKAKVVRFHDDTRIHVSQIINGTGRTSSFTYSVLSENDAPYSKDTIDCSFPVVKNVCPILVVKDHSETVSHGGVVKTSYNYEGLRTHVQGKGMLGFMKVSSKTWLTDVIYHKKQDEYAFDLNKFFPYLKKESVLLNGTDSISSTENTYTFGNATDKWFFPNLQKVKEKEHLRGFFKEMTIDESDIYGNPTIITIKKGSIATGAIDVTETITSEYQNWNTISASVRRLGIPSRIHKKTSRGGSEWIDETVLFNNYLGVPMQKENYVGNLSGRKRKSTEEFSYNSFGETLTSSLKPYSSTTALVTSYQYSANGRDLIQKTDPVGLSESYTYDATRGLLATKTDYRGNVTSFEYDAMMRTKRILYPDGARDSVYYSWSTGAPNSVYCVTETHSNQPTTKTYYDLAGNEVRKSVQHFDGIFAQTDKTYNRFGLLNSVSYPYRPNESSVLSTYTYDNYLRLTGISEPSGRNTTYSYSGGSVTETKNGLAVTRTTNAAGELISTSDAGGTTTNTLRPDGNPSVITSNGVATTFGYDSYGRKTSMTDPSAGMTRYTYNASGFMDSTINARNRVSKMSYDIYGNKTSVKMSDITVNYTYNSYKEPLKEQTSTGFYHEVTYDNQGRLATEKWSRYNYLSLLKAYTYSNGNLSTISYTTHDGLIATEQYIYAYGHLKQIKLNNDTIIWELKGVNGFSQPLQIATGPLTRNYSYSYGFPTNRNVKLGSTYLLSQNYIFNPATGNLTSRTMHGLTEKFTYDNLNRLTGFGGKSINYFENGNTTGNSNGNIYYKSDAGTFSYANDESPYSVTGITLSGDGIPPRSQSTTYKSFNALSSVTENSKVVSYDFGEGFERIRRRDINASTGAVVSMRYYFGPQYEIEISGGTTNITKEILYLCNGDGYSSPVAYVKTNGVWSPYYISRDYLGSITHLYNSSGSLVQELSYDAWGRLRNPLTNAVYSPDSEPSLFLNRGYTGHEHLTAFGLIHMNARAYDPAVGRFLSPDPYVVDPDFTQAYNRYSYCMNNPLVYTDPDGEFIFLAAALIGAAIGGYQGYKIAKASGASGWNMAAYILGGAAIGGIGGGASAAVGLAAGGALASAGFGGFTAGAITGAAAGATGGFINGLGMTALSGGSIGQAFGAAGMGALMGAGTGALLGGTIQGVSSLRQGNNFWTGKEIALGRNAFSFNNTSLESTNNPSIAKSAPLSPYEKGQEGVNKAISEIKSDGGKILKQEVTLEVNGVKVRVDIAADFNGRIELIEVKNGPCASFTTNQKIVYPKMMDTGVPIIPKGANAAAVWGPNQVGQPTTNYYFRIIRYKE